MLNGPYDVIDKVIPPLKAFDIPPPVSSYVPPVEHSKRDKEQKEKNYGFKQDNGRIPPNDDDELSEGELPLNNESSRNGGSSLNKDLYGTKTASNGSGASSNLNATRNYNLALDAFSTKSNYSNGTHASPSNEPHNNDATMRNGLKHPSGANLLPTKVSRRAVFGTAEKSARSSADSWASRHTRDNWTTSPPSSLNLDTRPALMNSGSSSGEAPNARNSDSRSSSDRLVSPTGSLREKADRSKLAYAFGGNLDLDEDDSTAHTSSRSCNLFFNLCFIIYLILLVHSAAKVCALCTIQFIFYINEKL